MSLDTYMSCTGTVHMLCMLVHSNECLLVLNYYYLYGTFIYLQLYMYRYCTVCYIHTCILHKCSTCTCMYIHYTFFYKVNWSVYMYL